MSNDLLFEEFYKIVQETDKKLRNLEETIISNPEKATREIIEIAYDLRYICAFLEEIKRNGNKEKRSHR